MEIGDTITVSYEESKKLRKEGWKPRNDVVTMMFVGAPLPGGTIALQPQEFPLYGPRERIERSCCVHGCKKPHHGRGYCSMHLHRLIRRGDHRFVCLPGKKPHGKCDEPKCSRKAVARGLCNLHYLRLRKQQKLAEAA